MTEISFSAALRRYLDTPKNCAQLHRFGGELMMEYVRELCRRNLIKIDSDGRTFVRNEDAET